MPLNLDKSLRFKDLSSGIGSGSSGLPQQRYSSAEKSMPGKALTRKDTDTNTRAKVDQC
uniref:Uncharacterized protein n=1 Tax=Picea glauca TaxID=3330 RepID=A0A101LVJ8_PICGL|nr:hypothetical protein ABT39_MTgene1942 [Picea glauca]